MLIFRQAVVLCFTVHENRQRSHYGSVVHAALALCLKCVARSLPASRLLWDSRDGTCRPAVREHLQLDKGGCGPLKSTSNAYFELINNYKNI